MEGKELNKEKEENILIYIICTIFFMIALLGGYIWGYMEGSHSKARIELTCDGITSELQYKGFYNEGKYFCVATKGYSREEVTDTTLHELTHYYIDTEPEHFIKQKKENNIIGQAIKIPETNKTCTKPILKEEEYYCNIEDII